MTLGTKSMIPGFKTLQEILGAVRDIRNRQEIPALDPFVESCRAFAVEETLNVAVFGRFKAGKSSFLNHLLGKPLLPVGVIPVTSVITEIQWGALERTEVLYADGRTDVIAAERIAEFVAEGGNPQNIRQVERVRVELPSMDRYRGIRFVDTPGLESVFEHNTEASLDWLPKAGLALVAVGVDPPFSQRDLELIRRLQRHTPDISILLTKVDLVGEHERSDVRQFIEKQLARIESQSIPVFPFSVRPGFESLREELDRRLLIRTRVALGDRRRAILLHKIDSLLGECAAWLNVALKSAGTADSERADLRSRILGEKEILDDERLALRLIVRHAAGTLRSAFEALLRSDELPVRRRLLRRLDQEFPSRARSLAAAVTWFDGWLQMALSQEMAELSKNHHGAFLEPLRRVNRQLEQSLQGFRNRLSERTLEALGVPLRTTEMDLRAEEPKSPDIRVGRIFDHNWELLSWIIPMTLARGVVLRHFHLKVEGLVFTNLSRLASQWVEAINQALAASEKQALRRLDSLVASIERLTEAEGRQASQIREDLALVDRLRRSLTGGQPRVSDDPAGLVN
jgi:GTP-binding protein EngB required for normal cell division